MCMHSQSSRMTVAPILHRVVSACMFGSILTLSAATQVTVSNVAARFDVAGNIVNSHDGVVVQLPTSPGANTTLYYQYGTVYENCTQDGPICDGKCGYLGNVFSVYSSPDLSTWTLVNDNVLPALTIDNEKVSYWEANVAFNPRTQMYVMVYWSGHYGFVNNSIAVATSPSPGGPFINAPAPINVAGCGVVSDTVALFVDDDGTGYVRYNTFDIPRRHIVEALSDDWLSSTGEYGVIFSKPSFPWYDGGGMFKRGSTYYTMLSFDCCFCQWGSDALVFTAPAALGPWAPQQPPSRSKRSSKAASALPLPQRHASAGGAIRGCDLTGPWSGLTPGEPVGKPNLMLAQAPGSTTVAITGGVDTVGYVYAENSSFVIPQFPGYGTLVGVLGPYNGSIANGNCSQITWVDYTPRGSYWCLHPYCDDAPPMPPANWSNEVNLCADGTQPPVNITDMTINPCSQEDVNGYNFTIPAQQFSVSVVYNGTGGGNASSSTSAPVYLFNGEHFRSAPDGIKAHDLQAWIPLSFDEGGVMLPMAWMDTFDLWMP